MKEDRRQFDVKHWVRRILRLHVKMMKQSLLQITDGVEDPYYSFQKSDYYNYKSPLYHRNHSLAMELNRRYHSKDVFFSLEFLPPRTNFGIQNLLERFYAIQDGGPLFCSVTWHTGNDPGGNKETSSIKFAGSMARAYNFDTMLHLASCNLSKQQVMNYLQAAQLDGIRSVLALRGDIIPGQKSPEDGFPHAVDLIHFIRDKFGDLFTIGVAGYPSGHHEANSYEEDLLHLKEKIEAGADFIVSQIFFSAETFKKFVHDCKAYDITVPIVPGILPILSFSSVWRIAQLCHLEIPPEILKNLLAVAHSDQATTNFGIYLATSIAKELLVSGCVPGIHFFTLNREKPTMEVCKQLGLWTREPSSASTLRQNLNLEQLRKYISELRRKNKNYRKPFSQVFTV
ncbi:hypothetical protein J437_LFUL015994 [Ladona fulva]|uniref:Methylenetetrahydrofolate reductase (NAD(P)H) n=1 Tax=Ladona fulva TaxID=123851 RepID=A0A8K0KAQ9_LADFU|nr:hypothetical protein J437_LFUL015994 [Ladona fulva]